MQATNRALLRVCQAPVFDPVNVDVSFIQLTYNKARSNEFWSL